MNTPTDPTHHLESGGTIDYQLLAQLQRRRDDLDDQLREAGAARAAQVLTELVVELSDTDHGVTLDPADAWTTAEVDVAFDDDPIEFISVVLDGCPVDLSRSQLPALLRDDPRVWPWINAIERSSPWIVRDTFTLTNRAPRTTLETFTGAELPAGAEVVGICHTRVVLDDGTAGQTVHLDVTWRDRDSTLRSTFVYPQELPADRSATVDRLLRELDLVDREADEYPDVERGDWLWSAPGETAGTAGTRPAPGGPPVDLRTDDDLLQAAVARGHLTQSGRTLQPVPTGDDPGCDRCGSADSTVRVDGTALCDASLFDLAVESGAPRCDECRRLDPHGWPSVIGPHHSDGCSAHDDDPDHDEGTWATLAADGSVLDRHLALDERGTDTTDGGLVWLADPETGLLDAGADDAQQLAWRSTTARKAAVGAATVMQPTLNRRQAGERLAELLAPGALDAVLHERPDDPLAGLVAVYAADDTGRVTALAATLTEALAATLAVTEHAGVLEIRSLDTAVWARTRQGTLDRVEFNGDTTDTGLPAVCHDPLRIARRLVTMFDAPADH